MLAGGWEPDAETAEAIFAALPGRSSPPYKRIRRLEFAELPKTDLGQDPPGRAAPARGRAQLRSGVPGARRVPRRRLRRLRGAQRRIPVTAQLAAPDAGIAAAQGTDFFAVDDLLTDAEREIRDRVRAFVDERLIPVASDYWERAEFPHELDRAVRRAARWPAGPSRGYGCPGMSPVAEGLVTLELARGDGSFSTFNSVHSGLVMSTIALLGSAEQKQRWLPDLASCVEARRVRADRARSRLGRRPARHPRPPRRRPLGARRGQALDRQRHPGRRRDRLGPRRRRRGRRVRRRPPRRGRAPATRPR